MALRRTVRSFNAITIKLARFQVGKKNMPHLIGLLMHAHPKAFPLVLDMFE
jgi:hypothetical protein